MKTCSTCIHWSKSDGVCNKIQMDDKIGDTIHATIAVTVADDYGLNAELKTHPNFGCTLHENKP